MSRNIFPKTDIAIPTVYSPLPFTATVCCSRSPILIQLIRDNVRKDRITRVSVLHIHKYDQIHDDKKTGPWVR